MTVDITGTLTAQNSGSGALTFSLAGIADGSWLLLPGANATSATTLSLAGWTALIAKTTMGSRAIYGWAKIKESTDTSISISKSGSDYASALLVYGTGADDVTNWQVGVLGLRALGYGSSTTSVAPSITTTVPGCMVIAILWEATNSPESQPSQSGTGWTHLRWLGQGGGSGVNIETIDTAYKYMAAPGATGDVTNTYEQAQPNNGAGVQIAIPPAGGSNIAPTAAFTVDTQFLTVSVDASSSSDSDGTIESYSWDWGDGSSPSAGVTQTHRYEAPGTYTITLTVEDDGGATGTADEEVTVAAAPQLVRNGEEATAVFLNGKKATAMYFNGALLKRWSYTVADMLAEDEIHVAWRGLGTTQPEMTMTAYDYAVSQGFKVLEVSVHWSQDGVPIMIHDATTNAVTATSYTVASEHSSTLLGIPVDHPTGGGVLGRLEDLLDKYAETHVIFIDDKTNSHKTELLALLDNYPNPQDHFVWKGFRGWSPAADTWKAAGYTTWGIFYGSEIGTTGNPHSSVSSFDLLGMNVAPEDGGQTYWDVALATGKRVLGHVCQSATHINLARTRGATGLMTGIVVP